MITHAYDAYKELLRHWYFSPTSLKILVFFNVAPYHLLDERYVE
jgi:hypothetical protein